MRQSIRASRSSSKARSNSRRQRADLNFERFRFDPLSAKSNDCANAFTSSRAQNRCSVSEADQLFGALRKLKRTVELVRYPGGAHAFAHAGLPSHRLDAMQRLIAWFQRYL